MARDSFMRKALHSRLLLAAAFLLLLVLFLAFGRQMLRNRDIERSISGLKRQEQELSAQNLHMAELQQALQTESYLEREARVKLGLQKPGEHLVVVQERAPGTSTFQSLEELSAQGFAPPTVPDVSVRPFPLMRWWNYFFDHRRYEELRVAGR